MTVVTVTNNIASVMKKINQFTIYFKTSKVYMLLYLYKAHIGYLNVMYNNNNKKYSKKKLLN